jgi:Predicted metal-dependent phosphoesterases (PHP family)
VLSVELHAHSSLSYDGRDSIELLLEQAAAIGLDALAVTDHDEIDASRRAAELAPEYGLIGIPAMEISSAAGHVLGFGITERVPAELSYEETVSRVRSQGGIAVVPHPFQSARHGVAAEITTTQLSSADAIEVYNSRLLTGRANRKAKEFAQDHSIAMTAGSDAHISEMVGQAITEVATEHQSVDAILNAIVAGETSVVGTKTPWRVSFKQFGGGVKRRIVRTLSELV